MKATLIFDSVNDLIYSKWDESFLERMKSFNGQENGELSEKHHVSQLLSPIITSQRVMAAQFGNTYSNMQCKDNTNMVFDEWLDHPFMIISDDPLDDAHRELMDCKTLVQHICGQHISLLHSSVYQDWLSNLLSCRGKGDSIPGAIGLIGESGATAAALNSLKVASKEIKCASYQKYHCILFVGDKLLALYSSRGSEDLTPPDLVMLSLQCVAAQEYWKDLPECKEGRQHKLPWLSEQNSGIVHLCSGGNPCVPHSMHVGAVANRVTLLVLVDMDLREVGISTAMSNQILANLRRLLLQRNLEQLPPTLDSLEASLKKTTEALRRSKLNASLGSKLTTRMTELRKSCTTTTPLTPETTASALCTALEAVIEHLKPDIPSLKTEQPIKELRTILAPYVEFLQVKAMRYFNMGSDAFENLLKIDLSGKNHPLAFENHPSETLVYIRCHSTLDPVKQSDISLSLHKYVQEFPGLVHFVYVDRTTGRMLAPDADDCKHMLTADMIRRVLYRSYSIVREGYSAATWRVGALHACAVLWWERKGQPVRPARNPHPAAARALPPPPDILGTFYHQLTELAFPGDIRDVHIKELICIHLGLLPAATAVQQARRLAHAARDLAHESPNDLLQ